MTCDYCGETDGDITIQQHGHYFHTACYVAYVHDYMRIIKLKAGNIILQTADHNAAANREAYRIRTITEKF